MYEEFKKYKTGEKTTIIGVLPNKTEVPIEVDEYSAKLGDLIEDFVKHINKPWWKKNPFHNHVTKLYKDWLNSVVIKTGM